MTKEIIDAIALTQVPGIGTAGAFKLVKAAGSASTIIDNHRNLRDVIPDVAQKIVDALADISQPYSHAQREADFIDSKNMKCLLYGHNDYPIRLTECEDAPLLLYYCGNADLNRKHVISMVGTRRNTPYGADLCREFISELKSIDPDVIVVSGLAYGIDICSHRNALENGLDTVGVLAHGLDKIYPSVHRQTAVQMTRHGGLLTEYITNTTIEKVNFVSRNRIVAGIADAVLVVESAAKGGSLITANIAQSYGRELFAFPGRIHDEASKGCNRLIHSSMALSIESASDVYKSMGWEIKDTNSKQPVQQKLFVDLNEDESRVLDVIRKHEICQIGQITTETGIPYSLVSATLFMLEDKKLVTMMGAGRCRALQA